MDNGACGVVYSAAEAAISGGLPTLIMHNALLEILK